jgi:dolichol-phosphate mannosyltransferase
MTGLQPLLTMIIPTLNEAGNIQTLCERILANVPQVQIIVVDDSSTDGTADVVKNMIATGASIQLIERTGKPCLTESIESGVQQAGTPFVGWMDADLSHPPELIPKLLEEGVKSGAAIATRFAAGGSYKKNTKDTPDSFLATMLSVIMNFVVRKWLNLEVSDYTSGFIVCRRDLIEAHPFVGDYGEYFIEIVYFLSTRQIKIKEVPYHSPPRKWGESKTGPSLGVLIKRGIKYLWTALRLRLPRKIFGKLSLQQKITQML